MPAASSSPWRRRYAVVVVGVDAAAMALGWFATQGLMFGWSVSVAGTSLSYSALGAAAVLAWSAVILAAGGYDRRVLGVSTDEYRRVGSATAHFAALVAIVGFATQLDLSRRFVVLAVLSAALLTFAFRHTLRVWLHRQRLKGRFTKGVVVVGSAGATTDLVRHLQHSPIAEMRVIGACVPSNGSPNALEGLTVPVLGAPTEVWTAALTSGAETIAIADTATLSARAIQELAWHLKGHGIEVMVVPAITDVAGPRISFRMASGLPLIYLDEPRFGAFARLTKAVFDRTLAFVALVLLFPFLVLIGAVIRLSSPGAALFKQERVGLDGKQFRMWKFRTMVVDAEIRRDDLTHLNEHDGLLFKIRDDPRITKFGRLLRRWSIDELPQLWNILRGHMSVVGPRPPLPSEVEQYDMRVRRRLRVKPGLTGLWQVSGRSELSWEEGVRLDLDYIERWSLTTDLVIIAKTAKAVALRHGAC